ncbi:hypothetical protein KIPB_010683, partial [Kipferlia bialata]|eukprot:g10683.t1
MDRSASALLREGGGSFTVDAQKDKPVQVAKMRVKANPE